MPLPDPFAPQLGLTFEEPRPTRRIWPVRELVAQIRELIEQEYGDVWVEGEISNYRPAPSGHVYFTLKDADAQLPIVLFRRQAMLLRFRPEDGLHVLVRGRVSVYEQRGQMQLVAETMEPVGAGSLQLAFEQLKERLKAEGLFDAARKRPLPAFPRTAGIITSPTGAVIRDFLSIVSRRHSGLSVLVCPVSVQGDQAPAEIESAIAQLNASSLVDLIVLARGGGSLEDLAAFNSEPVARAIAASLLPIVSAIGHETDFTIADFVADLRAATPSAAAELITAAQHRIEERVEALDARVRRAIRYQLMLARQRLTALSVAQNQNRLQALIGRRSQRLDDLRHRIESAANRRLRARASQLAALTARTERQNPAVRLALAHRRLEAASQSLNRLARTTIAARAARLDRATARLDALSPLAVLNRGYALVYTADGRLLRAAAEAHPGQTIRARLAHGSVTAEVKSTGSA